MFTFKSTSDFKHLVEVPENESNKSKIWNIIRKEDILKREAVGKHYLKHSNYIFRIVYVLPVTSFPILQTNVTRWLFQYTDAIVRV